MDGMKLLDAEFERYFVSIVNNATAFDNAFGQKTKRGVKDTVLYLLRERRDLLAIATTAAYMI